ncbi:ATP-binding protein [Embleya sp. NBC_00888]|uniref:ATP-binding protein n=1 Tax=Embleya sp. NBC_00888 TaxID=2975960 RepID=UPI00386A6F1E|nr:ATP-binding protein [Embleya sp. NBC_00888]
MAGAVVPHHREGPAAALVVAELAANAVNHGHTPDARFELEVAVRPDLADPELLRIAVTDSYGGHVPTAVLRPPAPDAKSGRGLMLVATLAERWGGRCVGAGRKTVWAELDARVSGAGTG